MINSNIFGLRWLAVFTAFGALLLHLDNAKAPLVWSFVGLTVFLLVCEIRALQKHICQLQKEFDNVTFNNEIHSVRNDMWRNVDELHTRIEQCSNSCTKAKSRI